jgi:exonuclease III
MNYWQNTRGNPKDIIDWKNKCIDFLKEEDNIDFYILQEINPLKLFEKIPNQYEFSNIDYNILYHELTNELLFDGRINNFWGNAIFFHKKYKLGNNNVGLINLHDVNKYYYGRNGIMCYEFIANNNENIIIINIYNKKNYAYYGSYTKMLEDFENDKEIINILKRTDSRIIIAGDFNTGFRIEDKEKYNNFIELYNKFNFKDCFGNYSETFTPTYYHVSNKQFYLNDFCFSKNFCDIKIVNKNGEWENIDKRKLWKGLSDHKPLIIELK